LTQDYADGAGGGQRGRNQTGRLKTGRQDKILATELPMHAARILWCSIWPPVFAATVLAAQTPDPAREAQRAQELAAAGRIEDAIRIYQDLARTSPNNPVLLLNLAVAQYTAKHYREAMASANAALKLDPGMLPARLFLGASHLELGEFADAVESLKPVVTANPRERNARLMLGEAMLGSGRAAEAVEHLQGAVEMLPDNPRAWYGLGRALEALGRGTAANEAWARLMSLPVSLESHLHAAEVHDAEHRWREAAVEWAEALRLAPERPAIRIGLGQALFRSRDYQAAMDTLKPLLASGAAEVEFLYGASLVNLQQPAEAIPYLRAAIGRNSRLLPARAALGQAVLQTGKAEEAIELLKSAVSVDEDGSIHFQLFRAYQLTHREDAARQALEEYQRFRASLGGRP
jgi:tetratricopeptide (TPR) repeat protein